MSNNLTVNALKALADPTRLSLLSKIATENEPVLTCSLIGSCANALSLSQPTMSHHLSKLVQAGVLLEQKKAKQKAYVLNTELLNKLGINITKLITEGLE